MLKDLRMLSHLNLNELYDPTQPNDWFIVIQR